MAVVVAPCVLDSALVTADQLVIVLFYGQTLLSGGKYMLPEEKYTLLRSLPHLIWLIDGDYQVKKGAVPEAKVCLLKMHRFDDMASDILRVVPFVVG